MKIKFIKPFRFIGNAPDDGSDSEVPVGHIVDLENDESTQWLIDNGFAEEVKVNYLFDDITHDDQGDKVAVDIWFNTDKDGGHPKKMVDFVQFIKAINVVSQDKGFMTRASDGLSWYVYLMGNGQLSTTSDRELAGAFCFEWCDDAKASIKKHPSEWKTIVKYKWGKQ